MSTELLQQRKIPVGLEGAPTYIGEFHARYGDEPQRFHSYCREHEDFGSCGVQADAQQDAETHLELHHPEFFAFPVSLTELELGTELLFRLRTVASLAQTRAKHGEKLPEGFIEEEARQAVASLLARSQSRSPKDS